MSRVIPAPGKLIQSERPARSAICRRPGRQPREVGDMGQGTCTIEGCEDRPIAAEGLCGFHYRQRQHGRLGEPRHRNRRPKYPICSVAECERQGVAHGLCSMHYGRMRKRGTTEPLRSPTDRERFEQHVDRNGPISECRPDLGPCWQWTGAINGDGYAAFWHDGVTAGAYRAAYKMLVGPIPEGCEIDHLCFNTACVNPGHLEAVTRSVNMKRRRRPTHCKKGHPFDEANTVWTNDGWMHCRICKNEYNRAYLREWWRKKRAQ